MSLPEISRRCRSCGAAVRSGARFCPQCGVPMADAAVTAAEAGGGAPETREVESPRGPEPPREVEAPRKAEPRREVEAPREAVAPGEWTPPTKEYAAFAQSFAGAGARPGADETPAAGAQSPPAASASASSPGPRVEDLPRVDVEPAPTAFARSYVADGETGAGVDEADGAGDARGRVARVRDGTRARVGRMREEAIVVLEETPDDSGMRFVVAAAALFVVFLVLLFLSTTILR